MAPVDDAAALAGVSGDTLAPSALAPGQYKEYTADGGFSTATGRFTPQSLAGDNYWATKGIPNDRAAAGSTCRLGSATAHCPGLPGRTRQAPGRASHSRGSLEEHLSRSDTHGSALCFWRPVPESPISLPFATCQAPGGR